MQDKEIKALISLLDDDDREISAHVERKIISMGEAVIPFLELEWETNFNPTVQRRIEELIHNVQFSQLRARLAEWAEKGGEDILEGMWLIATYQYPDLELSKLQKDLEQIYYETWLEHHPELNPFDQVKILNSVIFGKLRFSANIKNFHSPSNSMINIVMESRKGNPITLSVIYMLIAQKLKLPIYGVNLPNLFILTFRADEQIKDLENLSDEMKAVRPNFYINPYNRGIIFSRADIDNYLEKLHLNHDPIYYEPCSNTDIVRRVLRNLTVAYKETGDQDKVEEITQLLQVLDASTPVAGGNLDGQ